MNTVREIELFAGPRELMGEPTLSIDIPSQPLQAKDILEAIASQHEPLAAFIPSCRIAVDDRYAGDDEWISPESALSLIPPVSGG